MNQRPEYDARRTGENLKRLRHEHGYTAEMVRRYIGIGTVQSIYKWERGECFPTLENFLALAELYETDPMEIIVQDLGDGGCFMEVEESGAKARSRHLEIYYCMCTKANMQWNTTFKSK